MNNELKLIKKYYGERFMHLCRLYFSSILEKEGLLLELLENNFQHDKLLYDEIMDNKIIIEFKDFIYSLVDVERKEIITNKTPYELMNEAGYILYECNTKEEVEKFIKYYKHSEKLCTFKDIEERLDNHYVFFAVKKNVDEILREDFTSPSRDDLYGTSVISIQFSKGKINTLSIKNRYNHSVNNPDCTFNNDLENIIPGLTKSFEEHYHLNVNQNNSCISLPEFVKAADKKYYKYNYESNNIYYCPNNIIINNFEVEKFDMEKYIVFDHYILDLVNKSIKTYDKYYNKSFVNTINNIDKISIIKEDKNKIVFIKMLDENNIILEIDKYGRLLKYSNEKLVIIENNFLQYNKTLTELNIPNVESIESYCLSTNNSITKINCPNLKKVGDYFLFNNEVLEEFNNTNLEYIGCSSFEHLISSENNLLKILKK